MSVAAKAARSTKGWKKASPRLVSQRRRLLKACGPSAFLQPAKLKFPVMKKCQRTCSCTYDCRALRAAVARAAQYGHPSVEKKARKLAKAFHCSWA